MFNKKSLAKEQNHDTNESMVQNNFGDRLRQARLALKLTTKAVAEEIKIREDYIKELEKSHFDFDLPEVYRRGFLRTYAKFLELDDDEIVAMLPRPEREIPKNEDDFESVSAHIDDPHSAVLEENASENASSTDQNARGKWNWWRFLREKSGDRRWQIGAGAGFVLLLGLLFWGISRQEDEGLEELLHGAPMEMIAVEELPSKKLTLLSTDNVQVLVRDRESKEKLFSGYLKKGSSQDVNYRNNIQISFSEGGAVSIRKDTGENIKPKKTGVGWMEISY